MHHFASEALTPQEQYKLLSASLIPRPIAWVTTENEDGTVLNAAPFSFVSGLSDQLPLVSLAIIRQEKLKDTAQNLLTTKEAVLHLVDETNLKAMNQTAAILADHVSEVEKFQLETLPSKTVKVPGLKNASLRMEAKLYQHLPITSPEGEVLTDLFILQITDFYFANEIFNPETHYLDLTQFHPIARLSGPYYGTLGEIIHLPRP